MFRNVLLGIVCSLFKQVFCCRKILGNITKSGIFLNCKTAIQDAESQNSPWCCESLSNALTGAPTDALIGDAQRHFSVFLPSPLIHRHVSCRREAGGVIPGEKWISPPTLIILEDCQFPLAARTIGCVINADSIKLMFHSQGDKQQHPVPAQGKSMATWQQMSHSVVGSSEMQSTWLALKWST